MANRLVSQTYRHFEKNADPCVHREANYPLIEPIFMTLCAAVSDANSVVDVERYGKVKQDWLRKFFPFVAGIPFHTTPSRVFSRLRSVQRV